MAIFDELTRRFLCKCGCGQECKPWSEFARGHHMRTEESRERQSERFTDLCYLLDEGYGEMKSEAQRQSYIDDPTLADRISEYRSGLCYLLDEGSHERRSEAGKQSYIDDPTLKESRRSGSNSDLCFLLDEDDYERRSKAAKQAYIDDPTLKERISKSHTGLLPSDEARKSMSEARNAFLASEEGQRYIEEHSGESHPNWKGGSRRNGPDWKDTRESIIIRDKFICQGCGLEGDFSTLEAHHIDGDRDNLSLENLITTCHTCNVRAERKSEKEYWQDYYNEKIRKKGGSIR